VNKAIDNFIYSDPAVKRDAIVRGIEQERDAALAEVKRLRAALEIICNTYPDHRSSVIAAEALERK